ncbi:putative mitochondrial ribosomal protein s6-2 [Cardiosporidium cionae]|uniref:Mitochondrial ribosomal protein s6-2 n=1 Tax=Cardiosporidium cionae TaxID=476202 RepID=A0ABQ7J8F3_9APIC|nr:putative mitochondrial ribosomal protein s6-2 [Cardiosporidium cionae]|eukprot:KAF8820271.1 putative mitochondrial ribosomal protein s6-2 [Cardiosporidium cionae]
MVFYESYVYLSKRMTQTDMISLFNECYSIISKNNGSLLSIKDLGWRQASYRVDKPRVGVFWFGHMFCVTFGSNPVSVKEITELYNTNTGVLRHVTMKLKPRHNILIYNANTANRTEMKIGSGEQ